MRTKKVAPDWQVRRRIFGRLMLALEDNGGWWCQDCGQQTEREEGEQGQPAHCLRCGSHRIRYQPPMPTAAYGKKVSSSSDV